MSSGSSTSMCIRAASVKIHAAETIWVAPVYRSQPLVPFVSFIPGCERTARRHNSGRVVSMRGRARAPRFQLSLSEGRL